MRTYNSNLFGEIKEPDNFLELIDLLVNEFQPEETRNMSFGCLSPPGICRDL